MGGLRNGTVFVVSYVLMFWAYFSGLLRQPHPLQAVTQDALLLMYLMLPTHTPRDLAAYLFEVVASPVFKDRFTSSVGFKMQYACQESRLRCELYPYNQDFDVNQSRVPKPPALPLEMWECIIDFLWPDPTTLRACSLVCHAWLPTTRLHLFRILCLIEEHHYSRFDDICSTSIETLPRLEAYVHELSVSLHDWRCGAYQERILLQRLPRMHRLRSLYLVCGIWDELSAHARDCIRTACSQVSTLMVGNVHFSDIGDLWDLLSTLTRLTNLYMANVHGKAGDRPTAPPRAIRRPRVEVFQLLAPAVFSCTCMAVPRLFQAPYGIDSRAICILLDMFSVSQYRKFQEILWGAGAGPEALGIDLGFWGTEALLATLDLRRNTSISHLSISISYFRQAARTYRVQLLPLLAHAPSLPLRTLSIAVPLLLGGASAELCIYDPDLVDDVLARTMELRPRLLLYVHMPVFLEGGRAPAREQRATDDETAGFFCAALPKTCASGRGRIRYNSLPPNEYKFPKIC